LCFGRITGFEWVKTRNEVVLLDIRGHVVSTKAKSSTPGKGSLTIGNKSLSIRGDGTFKIDAVNKTA
jgi:hypothetical protein